jgi:hypothetical protein
VACGNEACVLLSLLFLQKRAHIARQKTSPPTLLFRRRPAAARVEWAELSYMVRGHRPRLPVLQLSCKRGSSNRPPQYWFQTARIKAEKITYGGKTSQQPQRDGVLWA